MTDAPSMIDWELAVRLGGKLAGDGPQIQPAEAADCVAELRADAEKSSQLVRDYTGLHAAENTAPVLVVDRAGWVRANADAFASISAPLVDTLRGDRPAPTGLTRAIGSRVTGVEVGGMLGFLAGKVLGQFDPFHDQPGEAGRLLLVAPNIVHVEQQLGVDSHDFRLWVCLHEEAHRVQFTAVPWMRAHLRSEIDAIVGSVRADPAEMIGEAVKRIAEGMTGRGDVSLLELFASPEQRAIIDRVTGVMSLLEGHADVVMDGVGPEVIPSVDKIRARFNERRQGIGTLDRIMRRLLGLDRKMAQYRDGAVFVRECVDTVGMDGFNAVWASADNLPSTAEIHDPAAWVRRVHG